MLLIYRIQQYPVKYHLQKDGLKDLPCKFSRDGRVSLAVSDRNGKLHGVGLVEQQQDSPHASPSHDTKINKENVLRGLPWSDGPHISSGTGRSAAQISLLPFSQHSMFKALVPI